jgi:hypothetical protein
MLVRASPLALRASAWRARISPGDSADQIRPFGWCAQRLVRVAVTRRAPRRRAPVQAERESLSREITDFQLQSPFGRQSRRRNGGQAVPSSLWECSRRCRPRRGRWPGRSDGDRPPLRHRNSLRLVAARAAAVNASLDGLTEAQTQGWPCSSLSRRESPVVWRTGDIGALIAIDPASTIRMVVKERPRTRSRFYSGRAVRQ